MTNEYIGFKNKKEFIIFKLEEQIIRCDKLLFELAQLKRDQIDICELAGVSLEMDDFKEMENKIQGIMNKLTNYIDKIKQDNE